MLTWFANIRTKSLLLMLITLICSWSPQPSKSPDTPGFSASSHESFSGGIDCITNYVVVSWSTTSADTSCPTVAGRSTITIIIAIFTSGQTTSLHTKQH